MLFHRFRTLGFFHFFLRAQSCQYLSHLSLFLLFCVTCNVSMQCGFSEFNRNWAFVNCYEWNIPFCQISYPKFLPSPPYYPCACHICIWKENFDLTAVILLYTLALTSQQHTKTNYVNWAKWTMQLGRAAQKLDKIVIQSILQELQDKKIN